MRQSWVRTRLLFFPDPPIIQGVTPASVRGTITARVINSRNHSARANYAAVETISQDLRCVYRPSCDELDRPRERAVPGGRSGLHDFAGERPARDPGVRGCR